MFAAFAIGVLTIASGLSDAAQSPVTMAYHEEAPLQETRALQVSADGRVQAAYKTLVPFCNTPADAACWTSRESRWTLRAAEFDALVARLLAIPTALRPHDQTVSPGATRIAWQILRDGRVIWQVNGALKKVIALPALRDARTLLTEPRASAL